MYILLIANIQVFNKDRLEHDREKYTENKKVINSYAG
jgi:hypothetical protein